MKIIKVVFLPFASSLIKIHPCTPHKRRGNVRKNTLVERNELQSLKSDDDTVATIDSCLIRYISSFFSTRNRSCALKNAEHGINVLSSGRKGEPSSIYSDVFFLQICRTYSLKLNALQDLISFGSCSENVTP